MTILKFTLPAIWAPYLINGDPSGLEQDEIDQCDRETKGIGSCTEVSETSHFGQYKGIGHDLSEYTFVIFEPQH